MSARGIINYIELTINAIILSTCAMNEGVSGIIVRLDFGEEPGKLPSLREDYNIISNQPLKLSDWTTSVYLSVFESYFV